MTPLSSLLTFIVYLNEQGLQLHIASFAKMKEYEIKQPKYDVAPGIPFSQIVVGPSSSGKTIFLQSMILDLSRDCFNRFFSFQNQYVDSVWLPVKDYNEKHMKADARKQKFIATTSTHKT